MPRYVPGKTLQRCSLCGNFHASYLVEDARLGPLRLCYDCWKAKYAPAELTREQPAGKKKPGSR